MSSVVPPGLQGMTNTMLTGKNAVVYGGAGSMGGAVARAFAEAGADGAGAMTGAVLNLTCGAIVD
jgi:NAD(P)-dependent dehydrogenase (short-subunit alcohol dehydrogenase family)